MRSMVVSLQSLRARDSHLVFSPPVLIEIKKKKIPSSDLAKPLQLKHFSSLLSLDATFIS